MQNERWAAVNDRAERSFLSGAGECQVGSFLPLTLRGFGLRQPLPGVGGCDPANAFSESPPCAETAERLVELAGRPGWPVRRRVPIRKPSS